jgi:hypothetical protein
MLDNVFQQDHVDFVPSRGQQGAQFDESLFRPAAAEVRDHQGEPAGPWIHVQDIL